MTVARVRTIRTPKRRDCLLLAVSLLGCACGSRSCSGFYSEREPSQSASSNAASTTAGDPHYKIDQFGYLPDEEKIAVISAAQAGFDAPDRFTPGTALEVRRWPTGETVLAVAPIPWNGGATDPIAGDKGWWVDFSALRAPGEYVLVDSQRGKRSHVFRVGSDVYDAVLVQALRTFYYQREAFDKQPPFADPRWTDGPSQLNDRRARSVFAKADPATEREMSGGWMDAGDQNKYVTFLDGVLPCLLYAYRHYPEVFGDHSNIPESGNGIPDLLDEVDWEVKWLLKMQDVDGGVFIKLGATNTRDPSPPSADRRPRYYGKKCSSAAISFAAAVAQVALIYRDIPAWVPAVPSLTAAAEKAWDWLVAHPTLDDACDQGEISSGDADRTIPEQRMDQVRASVWLYALTGHSKYHDYVKANYQNLHGMSKDCWGPYTVTNDDAAFAYVASPNAEPTIRAALLEAAAKQSGACSEYYSFKPESALYRAYMPRQAFHWGSNMPRAHAGNVLMRMIEHDVNRADHGAYLKRVLQHLHWFHGVNALGLVYLSNMGGFGAERSVDQFFHTWFAHGSDWDSVRSSPKGPPPGYLVGGPNTSYGKESWYPPKARGLSPPYNQPPEKSYKDFNEPDLASYAVTENGIYYQSAYIRLLAAVIHTQGKLQ